jgi:acyl dehydratase
MTETTQIRVTRTGDSVLEGDELPSLDIDITTSLIVATAIASRDFMPVHHDRDFAQSQGSKDIFMNILTSSGLVGRYATDWAGPEAIVKKITIRLGVPNYPGDVMRMTGTVTSKTRHGSDTDVEVAVRGKNGLGDHVTGTVVVSLPDESVGSRRAS